MTAGEKTRILKRQKWKCAICKKVDLSKSVPHFDHKIALALGGSDTTRNIQCLCGTCHSEKTREDRDKIAKKKRKEKEDPFDLNFDIFGNKRKVGKKDPFDIF